MTGSLQVKNGKYYMVLNGTENGKRKQRWVSTGLTEKGNKRKAEQMLREKLAEEERKVPDGDAANIWFTDYLQYWLMLSQQRVDAVTMQGYQMLTQRHVLPWFEKKHLKLSEVSHKVLQEFLDEESRCGRLDGKGGLSPKSVRGLKNVLNQTFNEAVREELLTVNPCNLLRLPPKETPQAQFYTPEQLNTLLTLVRAEPLYPLIRTAIVYGLRRSELLGLKWDSLDFENGTLVIRHTVVKVYTTVAKDKTKTKSSYRSFPLLPEMNEMFRSLRANQERNQRLLGKDYVQTDYVFCWPDGRPFTSDYVSHRFGKLLKKYDLPHIRFHELRHSCASLLINQGCDLKQVQEWMGHSDISTTANIYGHLETKRKEAMATMVSSCIIE